MIFREQVILYSQAGALPAQGLDSVISQAKALDMEKVRKDILEQEKETPATGA
jgi:thioredoxin 1